MHATSFLDHGGWTPRLAPWAEAIASDAAASDASGAWPARSLEALRGSGLMQLALSGQPDEGVDGTACALAAAELGRHCATTAVAFCAHAAPLLWMQAGGQAGHAALHAQRVLEQGKLYAQALSDAAECAHGARSQGVLAREVAGGYLLHGRKPGVLLHDVADYHVLLCTLDRPGATPRDTLLLAVEVGLPGTAIDRTHAPTGLRGLGLGDLVLHDVFVPQVETLLPVGVNATLARCRPDLLLLLLAPLMGVAQGAYDATIACLRGTGPAHRASSATLPRRDGHAHHTVARMKLRLEQALALWRSAVVAAPVDPGAEAYQALLVACHAVADHSLALCGMAMQVCGLPGQVRGRPLERLLRDAHSLSAWLPWSLESSLEALGRECLAPGEDAREPDAL